MATEVDVANMALSHLGIAARVTSISPSDGRYESDKCAEFFPIARDMLLEMHDWSFATVREVLAELDVGVPDSWTYAYAKPNSCLRILAVMPAEYGNDYGSEIPGYPTGQEYVQETEPVSDTTIIFTNVEEATIRYVARETDISRYSATAVVALSHLLASLLAGALVKGVAGVKLAGASMQMASMFVSQAKERDANQGHLKVNHVPSFLSGR